MNDIKNNTIKKTKNSVAAQPAHWVDIYAQRILREHGEKSCYTCASGITPSGTVHIGNFREIISVDLVVRALKNALSGTTALVRFLYSWDDFDVFRKVPVNVPNPEEFENYLRKPIVDIPDPYNRAESYARGNELDIERTLDIVGIHPEYKYQSREYRAGVYAHGMKAALDNRQKIMDILNRHRTEPLPDTWYPVSVFSSFTGKDTTTIVSWDGQWSLTYRCNETEKEETVDLRKTSIAKLLWRIDWPMRWKHEDVDFEPAGKDHHSQGGSFDTASNIVSLVYGGTAPITFQYDFVRVKGGSGKLSSSSGEVVSVRDVLAVYQPQIVRYLFAGTRPNSEFAISFDADVIKIYEDYDRCERIYFGHETVGDARSVKEKRIYELSQVGEVPLSMPRQIPLRHLCSVLQTYNGDIDRTLDYLEVAPEHREYILARCQCALHWVHTHAPEDFTFSLLSADEPFECSSPETAHAFMLLRETLSDAWEGMSDKNISDAIYSCARDAGIEPHMFFADLYARLIGKQKGPRLGSFFTILGKDTVLRYLTV